MADSPAPVPTARLVGFFPASATSLNITDFPAAQLTHVVYANAGVSDEGECVLADAANDEANLQQLLTLKRQHPKVMTLLSIGGPQHSKHFADAAKTAASRKKFAHSCVRVMKHNALDGIDIAWQFPSDHDRRRFAELMGELRRRLDAEGEKDQRQYLLTLVGPAEPHRLAAMDLAHVHQKVDWVNLAAFDFAVATSAVTDFNAPLFPAADDPAPAAARLTHNVDAVVKAYLEADVPAEKIVIGVRFAGTGWQGVPANASNGLYQTNTGPAKGTWDAAGAPPSGGLGYQDIETNYLGSYTRYWHPSAQVPWLYSAATGIMISYEDPQSLTAKAGYAATNKLGGIAVFDLAADDTQHSLLGAIAGTVMPAPPVVSLAGANPTESVLANLKAGGPAAEFINDTLNIALRNTLAQAATNAGETVLASLVQAIPAVDIASQSGVTVHDFVQQQITMPTSSADAQAATAAIAKLSTTATIADVLGLNQPLGANRLFAGEANKANLANLLGTSTAATANQTLAQDFITALTGFKGAAADFWTSLGNNPEFQNSVPELQLTMQLGSLSLDNPPLVAALRARFPTMTSPQALTALSASDLQQLITAQNIPIPASIAGTSAAEKSANYATAIIGILKDSYPGTYFAQGLQQAVGAANDSVSQGVATFLANAPDFDFLHSGLGAYVAKNGQTAFKGIDAAQQQAVTARLATWQRVARVGSDFPTANALVTAGFASAYAVASAPRASVIQKLSGPLGSPAQAEAIYGRAQQIAGATMGLYANMRQGLNMPGLRVIGNLSGEIAKLLAGYGTTGFPNWQTLFGSLSTCSCTDCRSVYSAAAYFVDLLQFLRNSGLNGMGQSPYDVLVARRPDLPYIKLNCVNTDTELPYVDLVNEIMEAFVVISNGTFTPPAALNLPAGYPAHDTPKDATAAELSVSPLYTQDDAYNQHLSSAVFPPTLPFDRWLLTARTYLTFTGVNLYALMAARQTVPAPPVYDVTSTALAVLAGPFVKLPPFVKYDAFLHRLSVAGALTSSAHAELLGRSTNPNYQTAINNLYTKSQAELATGTPPQIAVACEYLNISEAECIILTGRDFSGAAPASPHQTYEYYGFPLGTGPTWVSTIATVETFLQSMAIAYDDLVALLETRALNPRSTIMLQANGSDPCDLTNTTIVDLSNGGVLTPGTLDAFHRFIRLWRKLGWAIGDLDKAMTALRTPTIDQQLLFELFGVQQLVAATGMPLLSGLGLFGAIDADGRNSLYVSLFQNPAVVNPPPATLTLTYLAPLAAPPVLQFPSPLFPNLTYQAGMLSLNGAMTDAQQQALLLLSTDPAYTNAISQLHNNGAAGITTGAALANLPVAVLPTWLNYNAGTHQISCTGAMADDDRAQLNFSSDPTYQASIDLLYDMRSLFGVQLNTTSTITDNIPAILAALGISAQDLAALCAHTKLQMSGPPISLNDLTTLTRYALLAQGMGSPISDLLTVIALIGTDPFGAQSPAAMLAFVKAVQAIQASPFSIAQLGYLFLNVVDPNAGIAPAPTNIGLLLTTLQTGLAGIARANAVIPDPKGALLAVALAKLLGTDLANAAMGLITGSGVYSAPLAAPLPTINLPAFVSYNAATQVLGLVGVMTALQEAELMSLSDDPAYQAAVATLSNASQAGGAGGTYTAPLVALPALGLPGSSPAMVYDAASQMLRVTGPLTTAQQAFLLSLSSDASYQAAVNSLHQQPIDFITANLAAFLDPTTAITQLIDSPTPQTVAQKVAYVAAGLMPYLTNIQCRSLIKQTLSDNLSLDPQMCDLLLNAILSSQVYPSTAAAPVHAISDYLALLGDGLSAAYYANPNLTGPSAATRIDATVDFAWGFGPPNVPGIAAPPFSAKWIGFVMPQYSEAYTFYVKAGDGVRLSVNGVQIVNSWADGSPTEHASTKTVLLAAGQLYAIELDYYDNTASASVTLSWSSPSTPKAIIPQTQLFSGTIPALPLTTPLMQLIVDSYLLLFKVSLLVNTFPLSVAEIGYFYANNGYFAGVDPGNPSVKAPFDPNVLFGSPTKFTPAATFNVWQRLDAIVTLRNALPGRAPGLLNVFATALASVTGPTPVAQGVLSAPVSVAVLTATNWNASDLGVLVSTGGLNLTDADFTNEIGLVRLQSCVAVTTRLGISAQQLFMWTPFGSDPATEQANAATIQSVVKARYDDTTWVTVGKPLNDTIREASKQALIAYLLANAGNWGMPAPDGGGALTTSDQLYEFFLIDVDMGTCMLTSRIVQATAAVQLFVQRCLLNLESPAVSPGAIDTTYWSWMQNFRVWQANRQVFLYPENWMVPTLRDDKTPFFEDLENGLLQNPITNDSVTQLYLNYLNSLNTVALMDMRACFWQYDPNAANAPDGTPDATNDVLHVFGRTTAQPYKYYYRRLLNFSQYGVAGGAAIWTPWELVDLDIEGDHLIPVVWDGRLYLFWPHFMQVPDLGSQSSPTSSGNPPSLQISLYWTEYRQDAWSSKLVSPAYFMPGISLPTLADGTTLDTSEFSFNSWIGDDESLTISVWDNKFPSPGPPWTWPNGYFNFSHCGSAPSAVPDTGAETPFEVLYPPNSDFSYNSFTENQGSNGLCLSVGEEEPFAMSAVTFEALANTPNPYELMFPQQFFPSFGLLVPSPFSTTDAGEPFFYQDGQRVYFVTDTVPWIYSLVTTSVPLVPPYGSAGGLSAMVGNVNLVFGAGQAAVSAAGQAAQVALSVFGLGTQAATAVRSAAREVVGFTRQKSNFVSQIQFSTFFHPHVCAFIKTINRYGLPALLTLANQELTNDQAMNSGTTVFEKVYRPNTFYVTPPTFPRENVDFTTTGAYSIYNWELFFHIPLLVATSLSRNQQFDDARTWFHYIFNPTTSSTDPVPARYWNCLPFYQCAPGDALQGQIQNLMTQTSGTSAGQPSFCGQDIADQIKVWMNNPFNPFVIGRMRTVAFRMKVVMAYLDNLIAWGDNLFAQNTRESINEATQLYVLAKEILGPRSTQIPPRGALQDYTYNDLVTLYGLDPFSNAMVLMENDFPYLTASSTSASTSLGPALSMSTIVPYFCYPANDILLGYWDTVDDRLYKIRHCMNIQGVVEQLPLFSPPISPALLVAAEAEGVDLSSVLSNVNSGTAFYRFTFMVQKALELCGEVRGFGAALLAALQKQDDEALALLRSTQELSLLQAMQQMKADALSEAQSTLDGLNASLTVTTDRLNYYQGLQKGDNNPSENNQVSQLNQQSAEHDKAGTSQIVASSLSAIPNFNIPAFGFSLGGQNLGAVASAFGAYYNMNAAEQGVAGSLAALQGQWARRGQDWGFQVLTATDESTQIKAQIAAANYRVAIAQDDQSNLTLQIQNAQAAQDYLRGKYTNTQLYSWMVDQASTVHFQCYQMVYDLAIRAEAGFRFERGLRTSNYIQFGYWDSLKKGLMAGERLYADLKRMELAYLQTDVREYEITKAISLVLLDPFALISLKTNGHCIVNLPEAFFDQDYPGHYLRRIKTISLTIPCVTGPYTSVNCTLTLLNSKIRVDNTAASATDFASDAHFITNYAATQSIATSTAQNDAGMFEVNFRDEHYLPLEGGGAISTLQLDLPIECNAFDFDTITDVVINLRYTSRYGGDDLRELARQAAVLPARPSQPFAGQAPASVQQRALQRMFSLRHEFPTEWYKFLNPPDAATSQSMSIALGNDRFPFQYRGKVITITQVEFVLLCAGSSSLAACQAGPPLALKLSAPPSATQSSITLNPGGPLGETPYGLLKQPPKPAPAAPSWTLQVDDTTLAGMQKPFVNDIPSGGTTKHLNPAAIDDILMICTYSAK